MMVGIKQVFQIIGLLSFLAQGFVLPSCATTHIKKSLLHASAGAVGFQEKTQSITTNSEKEKILDWSFIDGVYLITCPNADADGSRISEAKSILDNSGLLDRLQVREFDTDDENRIRGCYTSHISVMQDIMNEMSQKSSSNNNNGGNNPFDDFLAMFSNNEKEETTTRNEEKNGKNNNGDDDFVALIIEDNLALSHGTIQQSKIDIVKEFCSTDNTEHNTSWDMIHLSYIPYVPDLKVSKTNTKDIVKLSCGIGSALGTTAYLINSSAIRTILNHDKQKGGFYAPIPDVMVCCGAACGRGLHLLLALHFAHNFYVLVWVD